MDETPGTVESEVWAFAATVYSLLAGRSPFEVPGEPNKSADLMARITRAKHQPLGRSDVPPALERALIRGMSRKPGARQGSVIELVHELQAIETELGLPQTAVESVIDGWALGTVTDLEDRTRIRGGESSVVSVRERRRRRRGALDAASGDPVEPLLHAGTPATRGAGIDRPRGLGRTRRIVWTSVAGAVLAALLLVAVVALFAIPAPNDMPKVANIQATVSNGTVAFSWKDPGLDDTDSYRITINGAQSSVQRSPEFTYDAQPGERVCITIAVNREGRDGPASGEKCADLPQ